MNNNKLQSAIIGGLTLFGLLILTTLSQRVFPAPSGSLLGCCNCLWPIVGGVLAASLYIKKSPTQVRTGDGAVLGALAGAFGGLLYLIIGTPLAYFLNHARIEEQFNQLRQLGWNIPEGLTGFPILFVGGIIGAIIYTALATIGGLIGIPLFEKRKDGDMGTPPPPPFGGQSGGGYSGGDYANATTSTQPFDNQPPPGNMGGGSSSSGNTGGSNL